MKNGRVILRVELMFTKAKAALLLACAFIPFMPREIVGDSVMSSTFYPVQYSSNNQVSSNYFMAGDSNALLLAGAIPSISLGGAAVKVSNAVVSNVPGLQTNTATQASTNLLISNGRTTTGTTSTIRIISAANGVAQPIMFKKDDDANLYQLYLKDFCAWRTSCYNDETSFIVANMALGSGYGSKISFSGSVRQLCCRVSTQ